VSTSFEGLSFVDPSTLAFGFLIRGLGISWPISRERFLVNISMPSCFDFLGGEVGIGIFSADVRDFMGDRCDDGYREVIFS